MSKIRDKDIQFLLDIEIPSDSEVSFCGRDDDMEHQDAIIIGPKEEDQILKEMKEMEDFQRNTMTELEKVDECIAINDEPSTTWQNQDQFEQNVVEITRSKNKSVAKVSTSPIQSKTNHSVPKTKRHNYKKKVIKTKWFAGKDNNT
ncbi:hypothetical protein QTP88_003496 [Uroleucon formosanum]